MRTAKVVESVDIEAPRIEVFELVVNITRRFQLSPLWGIIEFEQISSDYPQVGSGYHVKVVDEGEETEYDAIVTDFVPEQKFAYRLTSRRESRTTWTFQDVANGTRLMYHEEFLVDEAGDEEFVQTVRQVVLEWLNNIHRYAMLRGEGWQRVVKWGIDRFLLPLKAKQRRVILMLLAWEAVGCLTFIAVGLGWGTAKLLGLL